MGWEGAFDTAPIGLLVLDRGHHIIDANPHARMLVGDVAGRELIELVVPVDREVVLACLDGGGQVDARISERWLAFSAGPSADTRVVALSDVTERKRFERELAEAADRLDAFMDASPAMIAWMQDANGRHVYANEAYAERFGVTKKDILAAHEPLTTADARAWQSVQFSFWDTEGAPYTGGVGLDVSGQREAEQALEEAQDKLRQAQKMEAIGTLAGGIAHDFNNVLTVILSNATIVARAASDPALVRLAADILAAGNRAARLTRQLLTFSRRQPTSPRAVELNRVVADMRAMLRSVLREDLALVVELDPEAGAVFIDPGSLDQVIMNLVVNARDATPSGGTITIRTECVGEAHVALAVRDTGSGMDAATRARIFEPFFTTKELGRGTGLGLATVLGIVQQAGGDIEVESTPAHGSSFRITLPHVAATGDPAAQQPPDRACTGSEMILIAEDDDAVRLLTSTILRAAGYHVIVATDPAAALAIVDAVGPAAIDLLVTDVVMPGASGVDLADQLRRRHPTLRVLYVSGYADGRLPRGGELLAKPFTAAELSARVREVLDR